MTIPLYHVFLDYNYEGQQLIGTFSSLDIANDIIQKLHPVYKSSAYVDEVVLDDKTEYAHMALLEVLE